MGPVVPVEEHLRTLAPCRSNEWTFGESGDARYGYSGSEGDDVPGRFLRFAASESFLYGEHEMGMSCHRQKRYGVEGLAASRHPPCGGDCSLCSL